MKYQHRIDAPQGCTWPIPSKVTVEKGTIRCEFVSTTYYDLQSSYARSPHAEFMNATTDEQMVGFVKKWGPLYMQLLPQTPSVVHSLADYHARRQQLSAILSLTNSVEKAEIARESLRSFIDAEHQISELSGSTGSKTEPLSISGIRGYLGIRESLELWTNTASKKQLLSAIRLFLEREALCPAPLLKVNRIGGKNKLETQWPFLSLEAALRWMLWYDVERRDPLYCCMECRSFFKSESKHDRKFCNDSRCAKRVAARNWRRKDLAKKKQLKEDTRFKGDKNVTHKAR
jgi:hypothetical protein